MALEKLTKDLEAACDSGFALAVIENGQLKYKHYYGMADISHGVGVAPDTKFPLASISKIFTALMLHSLAKKGLIEFDKPIAHYVPELGEAGNATISKVMKMTSGFYDGFEIFLLAGAGNLITHNIDEHYLAQSIVHQEQAGLSGQFIYSNSAYIFLAKAIENVTGLSYEQALSEYILQPLNMQNTDYFDGNWRVVENLAVPNVTTSEDKENYIGRFFRNMAGAGHLAATLDDMITFASACLSNAIADIPVSELGKTERLSDGSVSFYGDGLRVLPVNGRRHILGHTGGYYGIRTALFWEPSSKNAVILLSNDNNLDATVWSVDYLSAISDVNLALHKPKAPPQPEQTALAQDWLCADSGLQVQTIQSAENAPYESLSYYGESKELVALSPNKYMVPYALYPSFFDPSDDGTAILRVGGAIHKLKKADSFEEMPGNVMAYVGAYKNPYSELQHNIQAGGKGTLILQCGAMFSAVEQAILKPIAKDYFSAEITESNGAPLTVYLKFEREQFSGVISGYILHGMRVPKLTFRRLKTF